MKKTLALCLLLATFAGCAATGTQHEQSAAAKSGITQDDEKSPASVANIVAKMGSDSYSARQSAMEEMRVLIARRAKESALLQDAIYSFQIDLSQQLQTLSNNSDPESQVRIAGLFEFQYGLTNWILEMNALPEAQRKEMTEWGLRSDHVRMVAAAYGRRTPDRAAAAKQLGKIKDPQVDLILADMISDRDVEVAATAVDACWDRPLTQEVLDALWTRGIGSLQRQIRQNNNVRTVNIRGRVIQAYEPNYQRGQEIDLITDLLIRSKDQRITEKLNSFFEDTMANLRERQDYRWRLMSSNYGDGGRILVRLSETYKPKQAMVFLMRSISSQSQDGYSNNFNNVQYRYSSRIESAAVLLRLTDQDPEEYGIVRHPNMGTRAMVKGNEKEEEEMIKKIQAWWKTHSKDFGLETAASRPADDN